MNLSTARFSMLNGDYLKYKELDVKCPLILK